MTAQPPKRAEVIVMNELILLCEITCFLFMLLIAYIAIR